MTLSRRRFMLAAPMLAVPSLAKGITPKEKHIFQQVTGANPYGEIEFIFSATEAVQLKAISLGCSGPAFAPNEAGMLYLWRTSQYFTFFLNLASGTPLDRHFVLGAQGPVVPAGKDYCFFWSFSNLSTPRYLFGDILYGTPE